MACTPQQLLARNLRRTREEQRLTLDDITMRAASQGITLTSGRLSDIERGRAAATLETIASLIASLNAWEPLEYTLVDLMRADEAVELGPAQEVPANTWNGYLKGKPLDINDLHAAPEEVLALTDRRTARKLGLAEDEFADLCRNLWGHLLSIESRTRAGEEASPQNLGRVTRRLVTELKEANA